MADPRTVRLTEPALQLGAQVPDGQVSLTLSDTDVSPAQAKREKIAAFLALAKTRFKLVSSTESQLRQDMLDDLKFRASEQWDATAIADRQADGRPCLTINRLAQFVRQVTNAQRAANLAVKVTPVDDGADVKTAETMQGLVRHIEQQSDAQVAYATASDHQTTMGRGYWIVDTEYEHEKSFVQGIRIKRIRNPFTVFMDPTAQEADGSDARFGFIVEDVPKDEYKVRFGDAAMASLEEFMGAGSREPDWLPEGKVKIALYWYVAQETTTLYLVEYKNGQQEALTKEELEQIPAPLAVYTVVNSRPVTLKRVKRALINAAEILEGNNDLTEGRDWPGKWIPIVPVLGDELDINGQVDYRGMIRDAKDPQRLYNFQNSALAETLALVPKAPFIGAEGQFEGHEAKWKLANRRAFPYLEYKVKDINGVALPPPQRSSAGADIGAIMTAIQQSDQDLKATMGLFEPSLGIRDSNQQSGRAIQALQKQGEQANSNFLDNLSRAIRFTGRIIVDLVPHIYDVPRVLRIIGDDETDRKVMVMSGPNAPASMTPEAMEEQEIDGIFDLSIGRYDVICQAGPSTATKRDQALQALTGFVQAYPAAFPLLGDLLVGSLDWPGAQAAAKRLKAAIPPEVRDQDGASETDPQQLMAQIQQLMQQLEMANVALQEAQQLVQGKQLELQAQERMKQMELDSRERIEGIKAEVSALQVLTKVKADAAIADRKIGAEMLEQRIDHAHERAMAAQARADDRVEAEEGREANREDAQRTRFDDRVDATVNRVRDRTDADRQGERDRASGPPA